MCLEICLFSFCLEVAISLEKRNYIDCVLHLIYMINALSVRSCIFFLTVRETTALMYGS